MVTHDTDTDVDTRRIHQTLGRTTTFWRGYSLGELALFALPPLLGGIVLGLPFVPSGLLIPVLGGVLAVEFGLWLLRLRSPRYLRLPEWLLIRGLWATTPREQTHGVTNADTLHVTRLSEIRDEGVERSDGTLVGAISIEPANMALQTDEAWRDMTRSFASVIDSTVEFPVSVFIGTREVDAAAVVTSHRDRLYDADVQHSPALDALLTDFVAMRTDEDDQPLPGERVREYYGVVSVSDEEIERLVDTPSTGIAARVGRFLPWGKSQTLTSQQRAELKAEKLKERLDIVARGFGGLSGCRAETVSPEQLATLLEAYWSGTTGSKALPRPTFPIPSRHTDSARSVDRNPSMVADGGVTADVTDPDTAVFDEERDLPVETGDVHRFETSTRHQALVAPAALDWEADYALLNGETYVRTFWIEQFPEYPEGGLLERLLLETDLRLDLSVHIDPYDTRSAVDLISTWIGRLQATVEDTDALHADDVLVDIERATEIRRLIRQNETGLYRVGIVVRLAADSYEQLRRQSARLEAIVRDAPANSLLKAVRHQQEAGLVAASPLGLNDLGRNRCSTMTGDAVGALFPFSSNYLRMESGIEYGLHGHNGSTILIDPWALETGHSELVTGTTGAGKTYGTQARALRMLQRRPDVRQVIIDPVGGMADMARALDARFVTVSGKTPLNPCELHPTPEHVLVTSPDMDPVAAKKAEVYGVIENFLASRDISLEMHSGVLSYVLDTVYEQSGIVVDDPETHTPANSPTMRDILAVLDSIAETPQEHEIADSATVRDRVARYAAELSIALQPFRPGSSYANLSSRSGVDILTDDARVVYLDLQQVEGTSDGLGKQSFLMQLLLGLVYQQAKHTDEKVEVIIDEAHYLFKDAANLAFLNQIARHQRHAGLRLVLLSQTLREFYDAGVAEEIIGMCPIRVHHREPGLDADSSTTAGLTADQRWFIQHAEAGKDTVGYSEALVSVDEYGRYPLTLVVSATEHTVVSGGADID